MNRYNINRHVGTKSGKMYILAVALSIIVVAIVVIVAVKADQDRSRQQKAGQSGQALQDNNKTPRDNNTSSQSGGNSVKGSSSSGNTSNATKKSACKLMTLAVAQNVLGPSATASSSPNATVLETADTRVSVCAYANKTSPNTGGGSIVLILRTPITSLGESENDTVFGSAKPAGVSNVQGLGQTAYWDPAKGQLNVLGNNIWYIISRSNGASQNSNTLSGTLAVAELIKSGF